VPRPVLPIDDQDVGKAVIVVVKECATRPHGFRKIFLSERSVVVREANAGLSGNIAEGDLGRGRTNEDNRQEGAYQSQTNTFQTRKLH